LHIFKGKFNYSNSLTLEIKILIVASIFFKWWNFGCYTSYFVFFLLYLHDSRLFISSMRLRKFRFPQINHSDVVRGKSIFHNKNSSHIQLNGWFITRVVTGDPHRDLSPRGDGDGEKLSPWTLTGTEMGNFSPRGDGDGGLIPDEDFPVAIPSHHPRDLRITTWYTTLFWPGEKKQVLPRTPSPESLDVQKSHADNRDINEPPNKKEKQLNKFFYVKSDSTNFSMWSQITKSFCNYD
jgi:hypothetical protein